MQSALWSAGSTACRGCAPALVDRHELAWCELSLELGADEVERTGLGGEDPLAGLAAAEAERAEAVPVAEADQLSFREHDDGEGALQPCHRVRGRILDRRRVVGDQRGDHLRVGGRPERDPLRRELGAQGGCN